MLAVEQSTNDQLIKSLVVDKSIKDQMLELVDLKKLENTLRRLSPESFSKVSLSWHIDRWATRKQHLFKLLGNKLKVEQTVDAALPRSTIRELYSQFDREVGLSDQKKYCILNHFLDMIEIDEISSNTLSNNYDIFGTVFKRNMKVSRIIAKLVHKDYVHEIQTKYSMFLQKLKARGTAVISIDPVDYITMSVNKSGWRSCHALDGEYRTGTLAYMVDKSTMISYVKTSEDIALDDCIPFSNKIWRQVVVANKALDFAIQSRQYPTEIPSNSDTISNMLLQQLEQTRGEKFKIERASAHRLSSHVEDGEYEDDKLWYNDILSESFSYGTITYMDKFADTDELYRDTDNAIIGGNVQCVEASGMWLRNSGYLSDSNYCDDREDDWEDDWDNDNDDEDNREW